MRNRLSSLRGHRAWALVALGGLLACAALGAEKERGRPIEFSSSKSDEVTTNLNQLSSKKDSLKELEEDLYKPMQSFMPKSLDGVAAPPPHSPAKPVIPNKRVKELLERRKNWIFANPKDLTSGPTAEEIFNIPEYGPDGQEKKTLSLLEQYYGQLVTKRSGEPGTGKHKDENSSGDPNSPLPREDSVSRDDANLPPSLRESEQALKKLYEANSGKAGPAPTTVARQPFSDIFGLGDNSSSPEKNLEHKKLMEAFQHIYDVKNQQPGAQPGADPAKPPGGGWDTPRGSVTPVAGLESLWGSSRHDGLNPQLGAINPLLTPSGPPDVNAQVMGQPSLTPVVPKTEVPKAGSSDSTFTAPKRAF